MFYAIPRGVIYQSLSDNLLTFIKTVFGQLNNREVITKFESEFAKLLGRRYCLAFPLARMGIYFTLKRQNFPPGSEIIMPPITIKGILDVILSLNLKPVFVDLDANTICFDQEKLGLAINSKTKCILITYLFGMVPDIESMVKLCKAKNLFVLEDFSQCLNGKQNNNKTGSFGDVGIYSASSIKTLDTYGGGLVVLDDEKLYKMLKIDAEALMPPSKKILLKKVYTNFVRNFLTKRFIFNFLTFPMIKLITKINPSILIKQTGERETSMITDLPKDWFYGFSSIQASVGLRKLKKLHQEDGLRTRNAELIKQSCVKNIFPKGVGNTQNMYWQLIAYFENPLNTQSNLSAVKIDSARSSLTKISSLKEYPYKAFTPVADYIYEQGLFIPAHYNLSSSDINKIVYSLNKL